MFGKFTKSLAARLGLGGTANRDDGRFVLKSRGEIQAVLAEVRDCGSFVTLQFGDGKDSLLTTLLAVSENGLVLDYGPDEAVNLKALASRHQSFDTHQNRIKIQFETAGLRTTTYQGRPAFLAPLPGALVRLQRRENYRLAIPSYQPVKCIFPAPSGAAFQGTEAMVLNISAGGIALISPPRGLVLALGSTHRNCRIILPDAGDIRTTVQVRNVSDLSGKGGKQGRRVGCQFVDLDKMSVNLIRRYILENEREARAKGTGF